MLHTDVSESGLGWVLKKDNRVVAYASRSSTKVENYYSVIQIECLAIVFGKNRFDITYLDGHSSCILIMLLYNGSQNKNESNALFLGFSLQEYYFEIEYNPGSQNANADALSRLCC